MLITSAQIPMWAKEYILSECPYCGSDIKLNSNMTFMQCSNPSCPEHMAYRISYLADHYKVTGIGPATARDTISLFGLKSHLDILPMWFREKPVERLSTIVDLSCIEGLGSTGFLETVNAYKSFEEFFEKEPSALQYTPYKEELIKAEQYFTVKKPLSRQFINVMITGTVNGFSNRNDFINALNEKYGDVVNTIVVGARKSNVSFLIKEHNAVDHRKSRLAEEAGIPIVTPAEYAAAIELLYNKEVS